MWINWGLNCFKQRKNWFTHVKQIKLLLLLWLLPLPWTKKEPVRSVVCSLFSVLSYLWTLVSSAAADLSSQSRRRLTFGPSEGSVCTSRPWVAITTQTRTVPVRACVMGISVPSVHMRFWIFCVHAFLNFCAHLCACSLFNCVHAFFTSSNHTSWFACLQGPSLCFRSLEGRLLRISFGVCFRTLGYLPSQRVKCAALISWSC